MHGLIVALLCWKTCIATHNGMCYADPCPNGPDNNAAVGSEHSALDTAAASVLATPQLPASPAVNGGWHAEDSPAEAEPQQGALPTATAADADAGLPRSGLKRTVDACPQHHEKLLQTPLTEHAGSPSI